MPHDHAYYRWYCLITQKYVNRNNAKLDIMIESHLAMLKMLPVGSPRHDHNLGVLKAVAGLGSGPTTNRQANNGHEAESAATATPSSSAAPLSTTSCGRRATASAAPLSTPSCGQRATTSPSTSATRGRG